MLKCAYAREWLNKLSYIHMYHKHGVLCSCDKRIRKIDPAPFCSLQEQEHRLLFFKTASDLRTRGGTRVNTMSHICCRYWDSGIFFAEMLYLCCKPMINFRSSKHFDSDNFSLLFDGFMVGWIFRGPLCHFHWYYPIIFIFELRFKGQWT